MNCATLPMALDDCRLTSQQYRVELDRSLVTLDQCAVRAEADALAYQQNSKVNILPMLHTGQGTGRTSASTS